LNNNKKILIVDDEESIRFLLRALILKMGYECDLASDGNECIEKCKTTEYDLILLDIYMPNLNGLETIKKLKAINIDSSIVVISASRDIENVKTALKQGAYDFLFKPFDIKEIETTAERGIERTKLIRENKFYQQQLEKKVIEQTSELMDLYADTLEGMVLALDLREQETGYHSYRVTEYSLILARNLKLSHEELSIIVKGALLHDIGKIGIPDRILLKNEELTKKEWKIMKTHPQLGTYLKKHGVVGIDWIDTRAITRKIRNEGAQKCVISTEDFDVKSLLKKVKSYPSITGRDIVSPITCEKPYVWDKGTESWNPNNCNINQPNGQFSVVVYDFGVKKNILRRLVDLGCNVNVVPSTTPPEKILSMKPDGILLSNGPGDPFPVDYAAENVRSLIGKKPIFGICLGHQVLSLALGGKTFKLKFGHRGANQPVKNLKTGEVEITSQNHGFAVEPDSFEDDVEITHLNLNDNTVEGIEHKKYPVFSVQYHPEASPGPHDSSYLFEKFIDLMGKR